MDILDLPLFKLIQGQLSASISYIGHVRMEFHTPKMKLGGNGINHNSYWTPEMKSTQKFTTILVGRESTRTTVQIKCPMPLDQEQVEEFAAMELENMPGFELIAAR